MKLIGSIFIALFCFVLSPAQVPVSVGVRILKAEDARDAEPLAALLSDADPAIRSRAALAAGRIGSEEAVAALRELLDKDPSEPVRTMAAFALGEIESSNASDAILKILHDKSAPDTLRGRAVEAAGKIAAANPKDRRLKDLGEAILDTLKSEDERGAKQSLEVILHGLTAALRARPMGADEVVARFLVNVNARARIDAANTLTRLRAKNANRALREMLVNDKDGAARANAARALGAAEDKESFDQMVKAAADDEDVRVRVSAIRALIGLKDVKAVDKLLERGRVLNALQVKSKLRNPTEKNELLEIATALGRLLPNTGNEQAITFLNQVRFNDDFSSSETEIAFARIAPDIYLSARLPANFGYADPWVASAYAQGLAEIAPSKDEGLKMRAAERLTSYIAGMASGVRPRDQAKMMQSMPDLMRALTAFQPDNLDDILRGQLTNDDVFLRAAAAELIGGRPASKQNIDALKTAAARATVMDKRYNDAQLAIMEALAKLDKKESLGVVLGALNAQDFLVRKKAFELLKTYDVKAAPGIPAFLDSALKAGKDHVLPYAPVFGTRQGQVLNTDADYRRALGRKNGGVKAVLTTEKGTFTIDFFPEDAPLTVDNFVNLARARYFDGRLVHRVVPNFVMQDGDPIGDGNGGPGWSIRCELNMHGYDRGAVGMALSGKDTGGSQWFVTHSPQPHLDGGYTVFGHVNETDMKVVDNIVRGDRILSVKIIEGNLTTKAQRSRRGGK